MAQSDQTVQNATFPAVRADINDNLAALYSQSSGASAPTVTVAFQPWIDTSVSPPIWKVRNAANTGWITVGVLDVNFEVGGITPIANGGTGQVTAADAINALLPNQASYAGNVLKTDGADVSWGVSAGSLIRTPQLLTSGTSYTTPVGCTKIYVECVGGGQGGDGGYRISPFGFGTTYYSGRGGNSGGYAAKFYTVTGSTSYTIAVGAAGTGGTGNLTSSLVQPAGSIGGSGGDTTFTDGTTLITAYGGAATLSAPTNGDITRYGNTGFSGASADSNTGAAGGRGADSFFRVGGTANGGAGSYGGGGGGGVMSTGDGGAGGSGLIRITEYA